MDKKIVRQFRKKIRKVNPALWGYVVCWCLALLLMAANGHTEHSVGEDLSRFDLVMAGLLIVIAANIYVAKYMRLYLGEETETEGSSLPGREELAAILRYHSFDALQYYKEIVTGFLPLQIAGLAAVGAMAAGRLTASNAAVQFALMILLLPEAVFGIRCVKTSYEADHDKTLLYKILERLWNGIYGFCRLLCVGLVMIMLGLFAVAIAPATVLMKGIADTEVLSFYIGGGWLIAVLLVCAMGAGIFLSDVDRDMLAFFYIKKRKIFLMASVLGFLAAGGVYFYNATHSWICVRENGFCVKEGSSVSEYALEDVTAYRVYDRDGLKMELTFADGTRTQLFRDGSESTQAWSDKYYSDYNYAAELTGKLQALGISGRLEDDAKLEADVYGMDPQCREGYAMIRKNLGY